MVRKITILRFSLFLGLIITFSNINAQTIIQQGNCGKYGFGDDVKYVLRSDSVLIISGSGEMANSPFDSILDRIQTIVIGDSVTSIGDWAFQNCVGLKSLTIGNSVATIGLRSFSSCRGLTSLTIPNSVTIIGEIAFSDCNSLTSVTIGNSVRTIEEWAFNSCNSLISLTIPNSVTRIGNYVFNACTGLESVTLSNSLAYIGSGAFRDCTGLKSINIPNSVITTGEHTFINCTGLTSVTIGNSVTKIENSTFSSCTGLTSVYIGNSVTTIGYDAFKFCSNLTSITIPNSVTTIDFSAFNGCFSLASIICNATIPPSVEAFAFMDVSNSIPIYVPLNSLNAYRNSDWSFDFTNFIGVATYYNSTLCTSVGYSDINFPNTIYYQGTYCNTLQGINGNDSVVALILTLPTSNLEATICQGEIYALNGFNVSIAGVHTQTFQTINGCDSIVNLNLTVNEVYTPILFSLINIANYFELYWYGRDSSEYIIFRNNDSIATTFNDSFQDTNVVNGISYCYKVKAVKHKCESEFSEEQCKVFISLEDIKTDIISAKVYPNPVIDELRIEANENINRIEVLDILGKKLISKEANLKNINLDFSNQNKGVYILKIISSKGERVYKIVKE